MENEAVIVKNLTKTFKISKKRALFEFLKAHPDLKQEKILIALNDISFTIKKGEILGIIGLNGSGKTTLLRTIAGLYKPNKGSIEVNGKMSQLMQLGTGFQEELDAKENIIINGMLLGIPKSQIKQKVDQILEYAEITKFSNMKLKHYSTGMRARLAFSIAMQVDPDILLVDEIQSVGDKNFAKKSYETFLSFKKNKKTVLHATHNLDNLTQSSDRLLLIHQGKTVMIGDPTEVVKKYMEIKS